MIKDVCRVPRMKGLGAGPIGPYMDGYVQMLAARGYTRGAITQRLRGTCALTLWMERRGKGIEALDEKLLKDFRRAHPSYIGLQAGPLSRDLLEYLREEKVIAAIPAEVPSSTDLLIARFEKYLLEERGLQPNTIRSIASKARVFLDKTLGRRKSSVAQLQPKDVLNFMVSYSKGRHPATAARMASALRSFCRFLHEHGETKTNLVPAVPSVAHWQLSKLPKHLSVDQVDKLLKTCDRGTPIGKRDYAILLLISRLGLRVGEVVNLRLEDIDWEGGEIRVCGKSERQARLPLPEDVGKALVDYLLYGRMSHDSPFVFLRMTAPYGGLRSPNAVCYVVGRAMKKANITGFLKGGHVLRHTLAKRMVEERFTLFEISEVLRHRNLRTTAIYAKVDTKTLHKLAQPWPGGA